MSDERDFTLADLIADAASVHLPQPRMTPPRMAQPSKTAAPVVIDLTVPAPRTIRIPEATLSLVEDYALGV